MAKSFPWSDIKHRYITTEDSLAELANRYGTGLSVIKKRSAAEQWPEERNRFRTKADALTTEKTIERISDDRAEINAIHYEMWRKTIAKLEDALAKALDLNEIDTLTKSLERAQRGQRLAKDMVTDKTSQEVTGSMSVSSVTSEQARKMAREVLEDDG